MFKWREDFNCNVEEIDNQHKKLFEIGSRLADIASLRDGYDHYDEIVAILEELSDYTVYHFGYEEKLMQKYGYEGFDFHKIEHDFFIKKLRKLERNDIEDQQEESLTKMLAFVADWVSAHILKTDMQYKGFFNGKGLY